ncbi:MAG: LytR C-terminal domain-containing protein [Propionibacteriaceae bacterium]|nr:LytR C-terminal domain-containing protein [Propionibacteriaceae bacterium]
MVVTPVVLLALLAGIGFVAMWGYEQATKVIPPQGLTPCIFKDVGESLDPDEVYVRVQNGGESSGMARLTATYLRAKGFRVLGYGNYSSQVEQTLVIGNSADDPEVLLVAGFFDDAVTRGDGRVDHVVDVILTTKTVQSKEPAMSIAVAGRVCLPNRTPPSETAPTPSETPTATPTTTPTDTPTTTATPTPTPSKK